MVSVSLVIATDNLFMDSSPNDTLFLLCHGVVGSVGITVARSEVFEGEKIIFIISYGLHSNSKETS